jgi:putative sterol carrier protein
MSTVVDFVVAERKKELERRRVLVAGDAVTAGSVDDAPAEVTFTLTPADADAVTRGELNLSVAFMRGTMKMAGDSAVLYHVLPVLTRNASVLAGA